MVRKSNTVRKSVRKSPAKVSATVAKLLSGPRVRPNGPFVMTDEQRERMQQEEPSDSQVAMLKELLHLNAKEIAGLTKLDASEAIDEFFATTANEPGTISARQSAALQKWGYQFEQTKDLSYNEAREALDTLGEQSKAKKASRSK